MYEVEFKVEITKEKQEEIALLLKNMNFIEHPLVIQNDYRFDAQESVYGGHDLKRMRDTGDKIIFTEKKWEKFGEELIRNETEKEISREEFEQKLSQLDKILMIKKVRQTFTGAWEGRDVHVDMDTVKFDHSDHERYFIEAEIVVKEKEIVKETKEFVKRFLSEMLNDENLIESPGMYSMASQKL